MHKNRLSVSFVRYKFHVHAQSASGRDMRRKQFRDLWLNKMQRILKMENAVQRARFSTSTSYILLSHTHAHRARAHTHSDSQCRSCRPTNVLGCPARENPPTLTDSTTDRRQTTILVLLSIFYFLVHSPKIFFCRSAFASTLDDFLSFWRRFKSVKNWVIRFSPLISCYTES